MQKNNVLEVKDENMHELLEYSKQIAYGIGDGLTETVQFAWEAVTDSDVLLVPVSSLVWDAAVILAAHSTPFEQDILDYLPGLEGLDSELQSRLKFKHYLDGNDNEYNQAVERMSKRWGGLKDGFNGFVKAFEEADGPTRARIISKELTLFLLPGSMAKGAAATVTAMKNAHKWGTLRTPKLFHNTRYDYLKFTPPKLFTLEEIRKLKGTHPLQYVILEDGKVLLAPQATVSPYLVDMAGQPLITHVWHHQIAQFAPVRAAGELTVIDGYIDFINNFSGHYLPFGNELKTVVEKSFYTAGYFEAVGTFKLYDFTPRKVTAKVSQPSMLNLMDLSVQDWMLNIGTYYAALMQSIKWQEQPIEIYKDYAPIWRTKTSHSESRKISQVSFNTKEYKPNWHSLRKEEQLDNLLDDFRYLHTMKNHALFLTSDKQTELSRTLRSFRYHLDSYIPGDVWQTTTQLDLKKELTLLESFYHFLPSRNQPALGFNIPDTHQYSNELSNEGSLMTAHNLAGSGSTFDTGDFIYFQASDLSDELVDTLNLRENNFESLIETIQNQEASIHQTGTTIDQEILLHLKEIIRINNVRTIQEELEKAKAISEEKYQEKLRTYDGVAHTANGLGKVSAALGNQDLARGFYASGAAIKAVAAADKLYTAAKLSTKFAATGDILDAAATLISLFGDEPNDTKIILDQLKVILDGIVMIIDLIQANDARLHARLDRDFAEIRNTHKFIIELSLHLGSRADFNAYLMSSGIRLQLFGDDEKTISKSIRYGKTIPIDAMPHEALNTLGEYPAIFTKVQTDFYSGAAICHSQKKYGTFAAMSEVSRIQNGKSVEPGVQMADDIAPRLLMLKENRGMLYGYELCLSNEMCHAIQKPKINSVSNPIALSRTISGYYALLQTPVAKACDYNPALLDNVIDMCSDFIRHTKEASMPEHGQIIVERLTGTLRRFISAFTYPKEALLIVGGYGEHDLARHMRETHNFYVPMEYSALYALGKGDFVREQVFNFRYNDGRMPRIAGSEGGYWHQWRDSSDMLQSSVDDMLNTLHNIRKPWSEQRWHAIKDVLSEYHTIARDLEHLKIWLLIKGFALEEFNDLQFLVDEIIDPWIAPFRDDQNVDRTRSGTALPSPEIPLQRLTFWLNNTLIAWEKAKQRIINKPETLKNSDLENIITWRLKLKAHRRTLEKGDPTVCHQTLNLENQANKALLDEFNKLRAEQNFMSQIFSDLMRHSQQSDTQGVSVLYPNAFSQQDERIKQLERENAALKAEKKKLKDTITLLDGVDADSTNIASVLSYGTQQLTAALSKEIRIYENPRSRNHFFAVHKKKNVTWDVLEDSARNLEFSALDINLNVDHCQLIHGNKHCFGDAIDYIEYHQPRDKDVTQAYLHTILALLAISWLGYIGLRVIFKAPQKTQEKSQEHQDDLKYHSQAIGML